MTVPVRECIRCQDVLPEAAFPQHRAALDGDGRLSVCAQCLQVIRWPRPIQTKLQEIIE
jgi:hypothetical protein